MGRRPKAKPERAADRETGQLLTVAPPPPKGLGQVGQEYWQRLTTSLVETKSLTAQMLVPIEALCGQWEIYCRWKWWLQSNWDRWTTKAPSGYEMESPQVRFCKDALSECNKLWKLLRLTPEKAGTQDVGSVFDVAAQKGRGDEENRPPD